MKRTLLASVAVGAVVAASAVASATLPDDAEWAKIKEECLSKPRRIIIDDDGCDATNFPDKEKPTIGNFYAQMLDHMVGNEFDVLVYCPCTTGFCVINRTKTGHRALGSLVEFHYTNITATLDREFDTDPLRLAHDFARSNGYEFVVNMRANDTHDAFYPPMMCDYKRQHPEYLVGATDRRPPFGDWSSYDFAVPAVRELFKTLVCEWFDEYDPDGFMIDFRGNCLFKSVAWGGRPGKAEMAAYTDMLREIRAHAEKVGRARRRPIYFMFRFPDSPEICRLRGIDLETWTKERLFDYFIAGSDGGHFTPWRDTLALCRKKGLKFYPSVDISWMQSSPELFKRNCHERFNGDIAAAYAAGADGIYLFNMFYATDYFSKIRRDPAALAYYNKRYFVTTHMPWRLSAYQSQVGTNGMRPALYPEYGITLADLTKHDYEIEVGDDFAALPKDGPQPTVKLYLKCSAKRADDLRVALNGVPLRAEKLADAIAAYPVAPSAVRKGANVLTLSAAGEAKRERETLLVGDALITAANRLKWRRLFCGNAVEGSEKIVEGAYRLETKDRGAANLLYPIGNGCGQPLEAEFSLKVEKGSQPGSVAARLANGSGIEVFDFMPGRVRLRYAAHQCDFDTERFHDYRVRIADGDVELWADGRRLLSGTVGKNADNVNCHLRGQQYRVAGMDVSSLLIGAVDPVAGAGHWKNVALIATSLTVNDAMLEVKFPPHVPQALLDVARGGLPVVYDCDCRKGTFPNDPKVHAEYRCGFAPATDGPGVIFNNDCGEYSSVWLGEDHPALAASGRYASVKWRLRCVGEPRSERENAFQVSFCVPAMQGAKRMWNGVLNIRDGVLATPFGIVSVAKGTQTVSVTVDRQTGDAVVLDGAGKMLSGGQLSCVRGTPVLRFGDNSSAVSGKVALEYLRYSSK